MMACYHSRNPFTGWEFTVSAGSSMTINVAKLPGGSSPSGTNLKLVSPATSETVCRQARTDATAATPSCLLRSRARVRTVRSQSAQPAPLYLYIRPVKVRRASCDVLPEFVAERREACSCHVCLCVCPGGCSCCPSCCSCCLTSPDNGTSSFPSPSRCKAGPLNQYWLCP